MNAKRERLPAPPPLLWSEDGRICCPAHAPFPGSDTWRFGRWRRMRDPEIASMSGQIGRPLDCETCHGIAQRRAEAGR